VGEPVNETNSGPTPSSQKMLNDVDLHYNNSDEERNREPKETSIKKDKSTPGRLPEQSD
jgi:hypothetical protein